MRLDPDDHDPAGGFADPVPAAWVSPVTARPATAARPARVTASSILMAAMLGLVDGLGFERPKDETVEVADAPMGGDGLVLDFKHLEPLEP